MTAGTYSGTFVGLAWKTATLADSINRRALAKSEIRAKLSWSRPSYENTIVSTTSSERSEIVSK
jgi:hypothetical protein